MTDFDLMEIQAAVLFRSDTRGRLTTLNEPPWEPAPRFFLGSTKDGIVTRFHASLDDSVVRDLDLTAGSRGPKGVDLAKVTEVLGRDAPVREIWIGPAYVIPTSVAARAAGDSANAHDSQGLGATVQIDEANRHLLKPDFPYSFSDVQDMRPSCCVVRNGQVVSICCTARQTSVAAEASLHTAEAYRGKGLAMDAVRAWASGVQRQGRIALYSTSWDNHASQAVARKLGMRPYGVDVHFS